MKSAKIAVVGLFGIILLQPRLAHSNAAVCRDVTITVQTPQGQIPADDSRDSSSCTPQNSELCTTIPCNVTCPTLRSAVDFGNKNFTIPNPGSNTNTDYCDTLIVLPPNNYNLTQLCLPNIDDNIDNSCGDLNLLGQITIEAQNQPRLRADAYNQQSVGRTIIDASAIQNRAITVGLPPNLFPYKNVNLPKGAVALVGLEIRGGVAAPLGVATSRQSYTFGGCVLNRNAQNLQLLRSTLTQCSADFGGGFSNLDATSTQPEHTVAIGETTIANNNASQRGGGIYDASLCNGLMTLLHVTLANNIANKAGVVFDQPGAGGGGGYFYDSTSCNPSVPGAAIPIFVANSIIAGNQDNTPTTGSQAPQYDCGGYSFPVFDGHNIVQNPQTLCVDPTHVIVGDPKLLPLSDNGGSSSTMALSGDSIALDTADNALCSVNFVSDPTQQVFRPDQRLANKPVNVTNAPIAICDIGAYEYQGAEVSIIKTASQAQVVSGGQVTYTITATNSGPEKTAMNVVVTDLLPDGEVLVAPPIASQGTCQVTGNTITCNLGDISAKTSATVTLVVTVTIVGETVDTITNKAYVTTDNQPKKGTSVDIVVTNPIPSTVVPTKTKPQPTVVAPPAPIEVSPVQNSLYTGSGLVHGCNAMNGQTSVLPVILMALFFAHRGRRRRSLHS